MSIADNINPIIVIAIIACLLSVYYFFSLLASIKSFKLFSTISKLLTFILLTATTSFFSLLFIGIQGYQALTLEEPAAVVKITHLSEQKFDARMIFKGGNQQLFSLQGDELMIDAYILKWKPWANILGLHTAYRLQRVSGRYKDINDEKNNPRTVFAINNSNNAGIAKWREDYAILSFLLDVEHGSASFVDAENSSESQLMVTIDGLLIRPLN